MPTRVLHVRVLHLPVPPGHAIGDGGAVEFALQYSRLGVEHIAIGIVVPPGAGQEFVLAHRIAAAVDIHVQASVEEMLVGRAAEIVVDHAAPGIGFAGCHGRSLDDACKLGLELDRAVLVEIPVEAVVVVADGREEGDHETARAAHFEDAVAELVMLPEDSVVLLMHADGILHHRRLAEVIGRRHIEVVDMAEAVATEFKAVGEAAEAVFAGVEGALPVVVGSRIRVWNNHFRHGGAEDDGADPVAVPYAEFVQNETLPVA